MKDMLAASKDTKQISAEQNSTCISQNTLQTRKKLCCSSRVSLNEENKLVYPKTNPEHHDTLESFDKNKNREVSSNMMNCTLLDSLNPMLYQTISKVNEAKTPNKNESVATGEQKSSKTLKHFKKASLAFDIGIKKKAKIDQTDPSAATASKSNESLTSLIPEVSQGKESEQQCNPYESVVSPTPEEIKFNEAAVKCNVLSILPLNSKKQEGKEICLTNSVASEPMNNRLVTEEVPLEKRILLTNSDKEPSQETVSLSMEEKEHPTTVTISESVPGVQKIIGVQKSICSAETQSVQENISVYKPAAVILNSTITTDNKNAQLKVVSLSENICTNLINTTHDSTTLNKSTEANLNEIQQAKVLNINNSDKSVSQLYFFPTFKPVLYKLQFSDKCENSAHLSGQQWNYPYNCYYYGKKSGGVSILKKTAKRRTKLKGNTNQIRPKERRIAPKISCETAVFVNNINKYKEPLCSGTNTQPENNVNKKPISSLTLVNFNETSCPLLPLAEETKEVSVIKPVQEYSHIKIIDVRTDIVNEQGVTGVSSSTDDIVQVKPSETNSKRISKSTNDLLQIQSPEIKIVGAPKNMNGVQIPSSEMDTMNQDSNPSKVPDSTDVESSISEVLDPNSKIFQLEVQMPQPVPEITPQQKPNPCVVDQDKMMPSAMKNMLNATAARQRNKRNRTVLEKQQLMLLKKEAMQKSRIDMLQNVFQVLNHCARMCASEDFEIWFKKEQDLEDVQSQQEITHTLTEKPGEWLDLLNVLKVEPVSENKTPKQKKSSKTVTRPKRKRKRPRIAACGSVQKRKSNFDDDATVADLPGTSSKNRKDEANDLVMIESLSSVVVDLEDVQSEQEVTHTLTENPGERAGLLKVLKVEPVSENKKKKRRKSSKRLTQRKQKCKKPEVAACGSVQKRKSNLDDYEIVADLPGTSSKNRKDEPDDLVMIESSSNVVVDLEDVQSQQEITHTVTEKPGEWLDFLNGLQVEPVSENKTPKRRRSSMTVTQPTQKCKKPEVAACGSVQERKSNLDDDATVADLPETSSKIIKVEPDDVVIIESSSSVVVDLEDVQSQPEVIHTLTKNPGECVGPLKVLKVEPVSENNTLKRRWKTVTQPNRNCKIPEVAACGSVQKHKSNLDDDATVADHPGTSSKIVEPDDVVMIGSSSSVVVDLEDVESQPEVIHTLTKNPGECFGLLKVLKVEPVSENNTPKRRWKTVTKPKRNYKIPEVAVCGADLPGTSSTIRKVEPNDLVMIESSSSVVSSNEPVGNLALPTTEVQEVSFITHDDTNLSDDVLELGFETWKTDTINDSETCKSLRRRKLIPETYKISRPYKKHTISTHMRTKLRSSRKWITESLKNDESEFIFTEDVIVKSEDIETKPDVDNYNIWNDRILCQDFGIQECYVRLRKVEDLYPSGYTCIDFDAIFS